MRWRTLQWNLHMVQQLDAIRACVDGNAAKLLDRLLKSLEDERKEWLKKEVQPPRAAKPPAPADEVLAKHNEWVLESLKDIKSIKPGMTRKDLLSVFQPAGGLYGPTTPRIYSYKSCSYFLIKVTFEGVDQGKEQPGDKIVEVSPLYLDYPPID